MTDSGLLYDPLSGATQRVGVRWSLSSGGMLRVEESGGAVHDVNASDLSVTRGGWRGDAITFAWKRDARIWALTIDDPQTIAHFASQLPSALSGQISAWQKQSRRSTRWSTLVLAAGVLITLLPLFVLIALFVMRDRIVDFAVSRVPTHIDAEIGERMHRQLVESGNLVMDAPTIDALKAVSQRLLPHLPDQGFTFRFEVMNDPSVNAFAAPGGVVVVHTGLLAKTSSVDELVGVLGHEVAHVTRRHSLRQIIYNLGLTTAVQWALGVPADASAAVAGAAADLSGLKFSRDQESDADAEGVRLLQRARFSANGLQTLFKMLAEEQGSVPAFLSTHPADEERLATLQRVIGEHEPWAVEPLKIDWVAVRQDAEARIKRK